MEGSRRFEKSPEEITREGGVPEGLHLAWPANPKGEESQVDSPRGAGHPLPRKVELPPLVGVLAWVGFMSYGRFWFGVLFEDL